MTICSLFSADCIATFCEEDDPLPADGLLIPADDDDDDDDAVLRAGMAKDWCIVGEETG